MSPGASEVVLDLLFHTAPDLHATMDIQIPALAWQPDPTGGYRRVVHLDDGAGAENLIHPGRSHLDHRGEQAAADADPLGRGVATVVYVEHRATMRCAVATGVPRRD
jgi:hypothetical protein